MASSSAVDKLTGVLTRDVLDELDTQFRTRTEGDLWSVMIVDVDDFKMVNDIHGHLTGDRVLQQAAWLLLRTVRSADHVLRFGGDEFLVVLPSTPALQAANVAQRFLDDMARESFPGELKIGVSLGLAESTEGERALSSVIGRADQALYESKARGKFRMSFFSRPASNSQTLSFEHFIDRQAQLRTLRTAFDDMVSGKGGMVLVTGEPGVGKSRLARELEHYCTFRDAGFRVAKYDELGGAGPFATFSDALCGLIEDLPLEVRHDISREAGPVLLETSLLFPPLPLRISDDRPPPDWARGRMFYTQCGRVVRAISSRKPFVMLLDDVQWGRSQDLDLLGYLVRTAGSDRVLFVFTMRSPVESYPDVWAWMRGLLKLARSERIDLQPLEREHASNMVMLALKDSRVPPALLDKLVGESGGNPFYLRELLKSLVENGRIRPADGGGWSYEPEGSLPLPGSVSDLVKSRLDMLDSTSREALRMCALTAGGFRLLDLAFLMESAPIEAARAIEAPLLMELVQESATDPGDQLVFRFCHDCVRSILLEELPIGLRRHLYTRLGQRFEEEWRAGVPGMLQRAAYSYCEGLDSAKAAEFALLAAADAKSRQATYDQALWLERYLAAAGAGGRVSNADLLSAWRELGRLHTLHARISDAENALHRAAAYALSSGDLGSIALLKASLHLERSELDKALAEYQKALETDMPTEQVLEAKTGIAGIWHAKGETHLALGLLDEARTLLEGIEDARTRARLEASWLSRKGEILAQSGDDENGLALCRQALEFYDSAGDVINKARAQADLAMILSTFPAWEERMRLLREAVSAFTETGDVQSLMSATQGLGSVYLELNQTGAAEECFRRSHGLAEASGSPGRIARARERLGAAAFARGDFESALDHFESAASQAEESGIGSLAAMAAGWIARVKAVTGCRTEAEAVLSRLREGSRPSGMTAWERSRVLFLAACARLAIARASEGRGLEEALDLVRSARSIPGGTELLESLEMRWMELIILDLLGGGDESGPLLEEASCLVGLCLTAIENPVLREDFARLEFVSGLLEMTGQKPEPLCQGPDAARQGR